MSATTTDQSTTSATPAVPAPSVIKLPPEAAALVKAKAVELINDANRLTAEAKAAGNREETTKAVLDNPPSDVKPLVDKTEQLYSQYEAALKERDAAVGDIVTKALKESGAEEKHSQAQAKAKEARTAIQALTALFDESVTGDLPELKGVRASSTSGGGTGIKRYRGLTVFIDSEKITQKINGEEKSGLSFGAKHIGVASDVFRNAFTDAAGTTDAEKFPETVEFNITVPAKGDTPEKTHRVKVVKNAE